MCHLTLSVSHAPLVSYVSYNMVSSYFILLRTLQRAQMSWKPMAPRSGHRWWLTRKIKDDQRRRISQSQTCEDHLRATAGNRSLKSKQRRCRTMECRSDSSGFKIFEAHPHSRNTKHVMPCNARGHQATQSLLEHRPWDLRKPGPSECQGLGVPSLISDFPAL